MKERPIIFSAPMVRALLEGRKTQTRRVFKDSAAMFHIRTDGCYTVYSSIGGIKHGRIDITPDPCITKRRLHGWERWTDLLTDEIQRLWQEGVRGLVSVKGAPDKKGLLHCQLVSREQEGNEVCSSDDLYGISWDANRYNNASKAFGRKSKKQYANEPCMGVSSGELAGQKSARERKQRGKSSNVEAFGQREGSYSLGRRGRIGFAKAYCADIGHVAIRYTEYLRFPLGLRLWVRETWQGPLLDEDYDHPEDDDIYTPKYCVYRADGGPVPEFVTCDDKERSGWRPSIHMPRWASRILLEIVSVRVERLQDISEDDAKAEGADPYRLPCHPKREKLRHVDGFSLLWQPINGSESWDANPWVWVVEFRRVTP